jgi:hypothetical protein
MRPGKSWVSGTEVGDLGEALVQAIEQDVRVRHGCSVDVDADIAGAAVAEERSIERRSGGGPNVKKPVILLPAR